MSRVATRKHGLHLRVPVLPEEEVRIKQYAAQAGLSVSAYLRATGMGSPLKSKIDLERVAQLAQNNADLGRLGGLLKWWLSGDSRASGFTPNTVRALLKKIEQNQEAMRHLMRDLCRDC